MNIDLLLPYVTLATPALILLSLLVGILLWVGLRRQIRHFQEEAAQFRASLERLAAAIAVPEHLHPGKLEQRISELEDRKPAAGADRTSGFVGASRRGQVLRLSRNGESALQIAEALGVSQGEVQLTLKLQDLYSRTIQ